MKGAFLGFVLLALWLLGLAKAAGSGFIMFGVAFLMPPVGVVMGVIRLLELLP